MATMICIRCDHAADHWHPGLSAYVCPQHRDPRTIPCTHLLTMVDQPGINAEIERRGAPHVGSVERSNPTILGCRHDESHTGDACRSFDDVIPCNDCATPIVGVAP